VAYVANRLVYHAVLKNTNVFRVLGHKYQASFAVLTNTEVLNQKLLKVTMTVTQRSIQIAVHTISKHKLLRNHTNVTYVIGRILATVMLQDTKRFTAVLSRTYVCSVTKHSVIRGILTSTSAFILVILHTVVTYVTSHLVCPAG